MATRSKRPPLRSAHGAPPQVDVVPEPPARIVPESLLTALGYLAHAEENARLAVHAGAAAAKDAALAMRIRSAGAVHEERRLELVELIENLGGVAPCPEESRTVLRHDAHFVRASARDDAALVRALLEMRADLVQAHIDAQHASGLDLNLNDLVSLPSLFPDRPW
jgi:hypothetical protein